MAPGPKTTWEELSRLGWYKQQVYDRLNSLRGYTMHGFGDMALNESFANTYQWYSYNTTKGDPRSNGDIINSIQSNQTVWSYDNTGNLQPFESQWTEKWVETSTATLSVTTHAGIELKQSITIPGVGGSEFSISISTESTSSETKTNEHTLENTWKITVNPGEKVSIERTKTSTTGQTVYLVDYGVTNDSLIGTKGDKYNDHYYWGYGINYYLNSPSGTMRLSGHSTKDSYEFKIVRVKPDGKKVFEPLPQPPEKLKLLAASLATEKDKVTLVAGPE
ncbi:TEER-decreasing protein [Fistulina hepatica ATCC 64428]|uniref:TEER-decreasing protein n=1 Tax=Fistulina hepatica ATCC 64428 TaxID=1128425 RepID=A0A0D7A5Q4_9AGAR|nr:TEER-decreasing protein [Fistulina hepatica ATCC 64428]